MGDGFLVLNRLHCDCSVPETPSGAGGMAGSGVQTGGKVLHVLANLCMFVQSCVCLCKLLYLPVKEEEELINKSSSFLPPPLND